jgi:hypothetical protein
MKYDDFKVPQHGWRKVVVGQDTLYLPMGITYNKHVNLWRVVVQNEQQYEPNLYRAWQNLKRRKVNVYERWHGPIARGRKKALETGVIGVCLAIDYRKSGNVSVRGNVSAPIDGAHCIISAGQCPIDSLTQRRLDALLVKATGLRWHLVALKNVGQLTQPVRVAEVPDSIFLSRPVYAVSVDDVHAWVDDWLRQRQGHIRVASVWLYKVAVFLRRQVIAWGAIATIYKVSSFTARQIIAWRSYYEGL